MRLEFDSSGYEALLRSQGVVNELRRRGNAAVRAAGEGHEVEVYQGVDRARARVRTTTAKAARAEALERNLTRAMTAAGGDA